MRAFQHMNSDSRAVSAIFVEKIFNGAIVAEDHHVRIVISK
jgi:hypothetical protein